jgi:L-serine dehydratase
MQSIRYIFKKGHGPSSSHTMGPAKSVEIMLERYKEADFFKVVLFGSLALTGKGHLTDEIMRRTFGAVKNEIIFDYLTPCTYHPNTLDIYAYNGEELLGNHRFYSVGGGSIEIEGEGKHVEENIYPFKTFNDTEKYLKENNLTIPEYVLQVEGEGIKDYLLDAYNTMCECIQNGLKC